MKKHLLLPTLSMAAATIAAAQTDAARPNVILLVADDLGYGDLSCYGAERVATPNVDDLAACGVRFTDAHAVASTSTPSRYSLLTGEYCFRQPGTDIATGDAGMIISPEKYTLADMFKSQGYTTAAIGKWHLGLGSQTGRQDWNGKLDEHLADLGFDYHYIMAATADRVPCVWIENGRVANYDASAPISVSYSKNLAGEPTGAANPELLTKLRPSHGHNQSIVNGISRIGYMKGGGKALWKDENIADSIAAHAVAFIEEHQESPFFMYLCTNDVHVPRWPHDRFRGQSPMGLRGDAILQFDWTVGRIREALKRLGLDENTLIILTSDNGPVLDDGYQDQAVALAGGHKPGGPWRGGKYSAFEAGTAVPFIVSWPGHTPAGKVSDALVSHIDDMASLARLIGAKIPLDAGIDSRDHLDTWLGTSDEPRAFAVEMAQNHALSLRTARWKYIEPSSGAAKNANTGIETGYLKQPQLYDMQASPYEGQNVYATEPEAAREMQEMLARVRVPYESGDTCFWYYLTTPRRASRYTTSKGAGRGLVGEATPQGEASQWKFVSRSDGSYDIINRADGSYIAPTAAKRSQLTTSATQPARGWNFTTTGDMACLLAIAAGDVAQMNQSDASRNFILLNWRNANDAVTDVNTTDAGCLFAAVIAGASAEEPTDGIEDVATEAGRLHVENGRITLDGYEGPVAVYDFTGRRLPDGRLPEGVPCIVKTNGKIFKLTR